MAKLFTDEQYHFVLNNYLGISNVELTKIINKKFNTEFKVTQIKSYKKNHRLNSGLTGRFEKGHVPTNKGIKGKFNIGGNSTSFKKRRYATQLQTDWRRAYIIRWICICES